MEYLSKLQKKKKRHFLICSASGIQSGLQLLYLYLPDTHWQIISHQSIQYPQIIKDHLTTFLTTENTPIQLSTLAQLDNRMTTFFNESIDVFLKQSPKLKRILDLIIIKKISVWNGNLSETDTLEFWNISLGDAQPIAQKFHTPVLTDFKRQLIHNGGNGHIPALSGDLKIAKKTGPLTVFINIGTRARMTIIDSQKSKILVDSETGPGTSLMDRVAYESGCKEGFDRDGHTATKGKVNTRILEIMLSESWFKNPQPKCMSNAFLHTLVSHLNVDTIDPVDKLSTATAFTALSIHTFYKNAFPFDTYEAPKEIWLSGSGTNNLALCDFLKGYFVPIGLKYVEELDIPNNFRRVVALGLSVQDYINKQKFSIPGPYPYKIKHLGQWVFPL